MTFSLISRAKKFKSSISKLEKKGSSSWHPYPTVAPCKDREKANKLWLKEDLKTSLWHMIAWKNSRLSMEQRQLCIQIRIMIKPMEAWPRHFLQDLGHKRCFFSKICHYITLIKAGGSGYVTKPWVRSSKSKSLTKRRFNAVMTISIVRLCNIWGKWMSRSLLLLRYPAVSSRDTLKTSISYLNLFHRSSNYSVLDLKTFLRRLVIQRLTCLASRKFLCYAPNQTKSLRSHLLMGQRSGPSSTNRRLKKSLLSKEAVQMGRLPSCLCYRTN